MSTSSLDIAKVRSQFPALQKYPDFVFADNAGGSQILEDAADRVRDYLINTNIQMGSDYMITSTERCNILAQEHAMKLFNAESPDEIVFGASSTQNAENLARALDEEVTSDSEIIVTGEHEANGGPWKSLAHRRGATVKTWESRNLSSQNSYSIGLDVEDLLPLISAKTRLIAFTACSNILGSVVPVKEVIQAIRKEGTAKGAKKIEVCVDCVAYAPHRQVDVRNWDVDYCFFSFYKLYGPHISGMYVRKSALTTSVDSVVHHFLSPSVDSIGYKLQPAGPGYESVWGTTAVAPYLESLTPAGTIKAGFEAIKAHDFELAKAMLGYLTATKQRDRGIRVVGSEKQEPNRLPTVSFVIRESVDGKPGIKSKELIDAFDKQRKIGIRYGHFYAYTLITGLEPKLDPSDGVVRVSFVHYNTLEDVKLFTDTMDEILYS